MNPMVTSVNDSVNPEDDGDGFSASDLAGFGVAVPAQAEPSDAARDRLHVAIQAAREFTGPWAALARKCAENGLQPDEIDMVRQVFSTEGAGGARRVGRLPREAWDLLPGLRRVSEAAGEFVSREAVLAALLTRVAAHVAPTVTVDGGVGPVTLGVYAGLYGSSGAGKGEAERIAALLLPFSELITRDLCRIGVISGSGIINAFMDKREKVDQGDAVNPADPFDQETPKSSGSKKEFELYQSRHRGIISESEGSLIFANSKTTSGGSIPGIMCKAFKSEEQNTTTVDVERNRFMAAGNYTLSACMSVQPEPAQELLSLGSIGLPQRTLLAPAHPESTEDDEETEAEISADLYEVYDETVSTPEDQREAERAMALRTADGAQLGVWLGELSNVVVLVPEGVKMEIRQIRKRVINDARRPAGMKKRSALDTHEPLCLTKWSANLALLHGSLRVTRDHFEVAKLLWTMTREIREEIAADARKREDALLERKKFEKVAVQVAVQSATYAELHGVRLEVVLVAEKIARKVHAAGEAGTSRSVGTKSTASVRQRRDWDEHVAEHPEDRRTLVTAALEFAEEVKWVRVTEEGRTLLPGSETPPAPKK